MKISGARIPNVFGTALPSCVIHHTFSLIVRALGGDFANNLINNRSFKGKWHLGFVYLSGIFIGTVILLQVPGSDETN